MPTIPRKRATAAKALKSEVTARGAETASDKITGMGLNSAIGVSSLKEEANLGSDSSNWRWLADERTIRVISEGIRPSLRVEPGPYGRYIAPSIHSGMDGRRY